MNRNLSESGSLLILVLVFGAIFLTIASSFLGYVITQSRVSETKYAKEQALGIAEAGLDYYKWYLAHYPTDMTNGTGGSGPYVHTYADPEGTLLGEYSLSIENGSACGDTYSVDITSVGHAYAKPEIMRTVFGRYARPTVSEYAYIINSNVWAGEDRTIIGPYHSNGVIRMDGINNSTVSSGQSSWVCDGSMDCAPKSVGGTVNAVYGRGPNSALWTYPAPPINFTGLTVDLAAMETKSKTGGGRYIAPSGKYGYRIIFKANGTMDVYKVTNTYNEWGYTTENGYQTERNAISATSFLANYPIPSACSVIFVEDKVWLEGVVNGKVTIAAADIDTPGVDPSIILNNNITYANGTSGLLAIAEKDLLIGLVVPNTMTVNGIFIAQNGRFGRNHYTSDGSYDVESVHDSYVKRSTLTINGTIVSNGRVGTKWSSGDTYLSGFDTRFNSYDRNLVDNPPPLTPTISDNYRFVEWREVD